MWASEVILLAEITINQAGEALGALGDAAVLDVLAVCANVT